MYLYIYISIQSIKKKMEEFFLVLTFLWLGIFLHKPSGIYGRPYHSMDNTNSLKRQSKQRTKRLELLAIVSDVSDYPPMNIEQLRCQGTPGCSSMGRAPQDDCI